jgi:drug/metabolite transporter (DMT)-like permease
LWTILATLFGSGADILMRIALHHDIARTEVIFVRGIFALLYLATAMTLAGEWRSLPGALSPSVALRSLCDAIQTICFVIALSTVPFAIATAGFSTLSIWMTVLGVIFLKESVHWRRWSAAAIGFCGMFLIVKPSGATFDSFALFGVATGLLGACRDIFTRHIGVSVSAWTLTFVSTVAVLVASFVLGRFEDWKPLPLNEVYLLAAVSILQVGGICAMIYGLRAGELSLTAPFRYLFLVWAVPAGYFFFGEVVDGLSLTGVVLIFAAGIYTAWREAVLYKKRLEPSIQGPTFRDRF